jgi:farnesyl-diphosphate farnesyltransferase
VSPFGLASLAWPLLGPPTSRLPASPADAFCQAMLPQTSRTFALSIEALPDDLARAVRVAYLMCRTVDTIEDDGRLPGPARSALFDEFDALVADDAYPATALEAQSVDLEDGADAVLCRNATAIFQCFRELPETTRACIRPHVAEMAQGMREYADRAAGDGRLVLRDLDDLERYCYYVAGTVGKLLTALFLEVVPLPAARRRRVLERAVPFGLGLQLVNIVKDVAADAARGICFVPRDLAAAHGVPLDHLLDPGRRPQALATIAALCGRAREHLHAAQEYALAWPAKEGLEVRRFCAVPLALALASLDEVEYGGDALRLGHTPKVGRATVVATLVMSALAVDSDVRLRALFAAAGGRHAWHRTVDAVAPAERFVVVVGGVVVVVVGGGGGVVGGGGGDGGGGGGGGGAPRR